MRVIAKYPIKIGKILIPKGTEGKTKSLAESPEIKDFFTEIKEEINGAYCIVSFPGTKDCLVYPSQLVFL